jgi:hypothetical protein
VTWQPGPASDEEDSPPGWGVRGDEPQATTAVWQAAGPVGAGPSAAGQVPPPAEPLPLAVRLEPQVAGSRPTADPGHSTGSEPPAADLPRPAVEEPSAELAPRSAQLAPRSAQLAPPPAELAPLPAAPAIPAGSPQLPPAPHRGRSWAAMITLLAIGLCGLAVGAAGAVRQVLPREFSVAQQGQIENWQMARRWRAQQAGQIFPATLQYQIPNTSLDGKASLGLTARRLGIAAPSRCGAAVSKSAAAVLAAGRCAAVLRATYLDASESMVTTVGVAALPTRAAALAAVDKLAPVAHNQSFAVHAFPLAGSAAAGFRQAQRQISVVVVAGPYVVLATAGFTDGRRHVPLATDDYIQQEMSSLVSGLADDIAHSLGKQVPLPTCPGAPGC